MQWLSRRPDRLWNLAGPVLRVTAEAGFFTIVYAALSVLLEGRMPLLGPLEFTALVALGAVIGTYAEQNPVFGAPALVIAVVGAGLASWLASPDARAVAGLSIGYAIVVHGIGWLGAVAVLRGSFIRARGDGSWQFEPLLQRLLPIIAVLWALAWYFAPAALRPSFVVYAMWGTLTLIVSGLAGLGLTRMQAIHARVPDQRVRSMWRWIVVALAVIIVPLALPFAILAGAPVGLLFAPFVGPLSLVVDLLLIPFGALVDLLIALFTPLSRGIGEMLDKLGQNIGRKKGPTELVEPAVLNTAAGLILAGVVLLTLLFAAYQLARWLIARPRDRELSDDSDEGMVEHDIVVPTPIAPRPRAAARRRRGAAHDAVAAYVNAVDVLAAHPDWARGDSETPAEHSLRVRADEMPGATDFSRLAADYQLARYAEVSITPREDRRALFRLDRLRHALRGH
ncbi:MAG: DUF4129 domain-containing protein [Candidatus Limnocylindrales bacterium]